MKKILVIGIALLAGSCASYEKAEWEPTVPWHETEEAHEIAEHQGIPELPEITPYDEQDDERGLYLHGYLLGWGSMKHYGAEAAGASWVAPRYAMGNSRLQKIWHEGIHDGYMAASTQYPLIPKHVQPSH